MRALARAVRDRLSGPGDAPRTASLSPARRGEGESWSFVEPLTTDANAIAEPVPRQPVPARTPGSARRVGTVRLPLGGPYRPKARLYRDAGGREWWVVRLWEVDRAEARTVSTDELRAFARGNRLEHLLAEIEALVARGRAEDRP